jgi:hypothetical protein
MPQPEDPRHNLRLPTELKKKLAHSALDNGRSMNAEILDRLDKSFSPSPLQNMEALFNGIASLSDKDRAEVSTMLAKVASILGK